MYIHIKIDIDCLNVALLLLTYKTLRSDKNKDAKCLIVIYSYKLY